MRTRAIVNKYICGIILRYFCLILLCTPAIVSAESPNFDLIGPRIEMKVTRGDKSLPIANVADLQPGDRLWIHPVFPKDQSVHFLLIVAFLQGTTNPPPENWFTRVETWTRETRQEGTVVTVPQGAEQALFFLAPETGGDFSTLRATVRGRPGVFVRATQALDQASLDRTRLDKYLDEIKKAANSDPTTLKQRSTLLAQSLHIRVDEDCFKKPLEQQSSCLINTGQPVIDDIHDQSLVATLTSGPSSDLITALGSSPAARGGYYSSYIGAVVDVARLMNNFHTAVYQYLPALSLEEKDQVNLRLNAPPSFHNPKSVLVIGLPVVGFSPLPQLRPLDPKQIFCVQQSPLIVPVDGAPLVFSTTIAHDLAFRLESKGGTPIDLPAIADAARGGFVIDTQKLPSAPLAPRLTGTLHGFWGFSAFEGPEIQLRSARPEQWKVLPSDAAALVVGHPSSLHLQSDCVACVEKVVLENSAGKDLKATWKAQEQDQLEVEFPKEERAGPIKLKVGQFGLIKPDIVPLQVYSEPVRLEHFAIYPGDSEGVLTGISLEEVAGLDLKGIHFTPERQLETVPQHTLDLEAQDSAAVAALSSAETWLAHATLKDGRTFDVQANVEPPRPRVLLVSKNVQQTSLTSQVHFGNSDELPQDGKLSFFLKTEVPASFPRSEKIEVATVDGSFDTMLSVADGTLILQDSKSVLAVLDPLKAFGSGAFGPLHFRAVDAEGTKGKWQSIAVLVRIPSFKEIRCPDSPDKQCSLNGSSLFLLDSVASDAQFKDAVSVPAGYVDSTLSVPRPVGTLLYIKLRDDPATIDTVALPVLPENR